MSMIRRWTGALTLVAAAFVVILPAIAMTSSGGAHLPPQRGEPLPASCRPTNYGEGEALVRRNAASRHVLVPRGPREVLLCRYWGLGIDQTEETQARAGKLAVERRLSRNSLSHTLAREFDRTERAHGTYSCPSDEGANIYSVLSYADQPIVVVETHLSGCRFSSNGFGRAAFTPARLLRRLKRLTS